MKQSAHQMNAITKAIGALGISLVLLVGALGCQQGAGESSQKAPTVAPAWTLKDMDGKTVSSTSFTGKVLVVDFWATWCPPCRQEIPGFIELQKEYGPKGVIVIGIDVGPEDPGVVKQFVQKMGINYPIVAGDEKVADAFGGIEGLPTTFVIDREGNILSKHVGFAPKATFESEIKAALEKK